MSGDALVVRPVLDASVLPDSAYGPRTPLWWGNLGLILIEGTMFVLMIGTYFYLWKDFPSWPPANTPLPNPLWGTLLLVVLLISLGFQEWVRRLAIRAGSRRSLFIGSLVTTLLCLIALGLRALEFPALNVQWDANAYGSAVWTILGLHSVHLLAETGETALLTVLVGLKEPDHDDRLDLEVNADYWYFVAGAWVILYLLVYWGPRVL